MFWGAEVKIPIFEFWQGIEFSPGTVQFCEILWRNPNLWNTESKTVLSWLLTIKVIKNMKKWSESHSVVSDSLWPHGLYSPWNSPGQNTGMGSLSLLQGIFPTQGSSPGLPHCRQILYQLSHKGSPQNMNKMRIIISTSKYSYRIK